MFVRARVGLIYLAVVGPAYVIIHLGGFSPIPLAVGVMERYFH